MVKVLRCHHFKSQTVIPGEKEPLAIIASRDRLFVCTVQSTVEVYDLTKGNCPKVHWFYTECLVERLVYNEAANYVAAIEYKCSRQNIFKFVKVYLTWHSPPTRQPMKVRIAGQALGLSVKDLLAGKSEVIDIPFSGDVSCLASCSSTSNFAIGTNALVTVYHIVEKLLPNTERMYKDVEPLIEVTWPSSVVNISLCEDYLACICQKDVRVIKIVFTETTPRCRSYAVSDHSATKSTESSVKHSPSLRSNIFKSPSHTSNDGASTPIYASSGQTRTITKYLLDDDLMMSPGIQTTTGGHPKFSSVGLRMSRTPSPAVSLDQISEKSLSSTPESTSLISDSHFVVWDFDDSVTIQQSKPHHNYGIDTHSPPSIRRSINVPADTLPKTVYLKSLHSTLQFEPSRMSFIQTHFEDPVTVVDKRDGACAPIEDVTAITQLRLQHSDANRFCHLDLIPTYLNARLALQKIVVRAVVSRVFSIQELNLSMDALYAEGVLCKKIDATCDSGILAPGNTSEGQLHSTRHDNLIGICCFVGGPYSAVMYSLLPKPQLLSSYKFASEALQVVCGQYLINIVTSSSLETYTCRCTPAAIAVTEKFDNVHAAFPSPDLEVCLVSIQPFIGITAIALSGEHVILLSKVETVDMAADKSKMQGSECSWSLYALQTSSAADFYTDMMSLAPRFQITSPMYLHLVQEGHLALRSHAIHHAESSDTQVEDLLLESCALLGDCYAKAGCANWQLALPYYLMSGLTIEDIIRQAKQDRQHGQQLSHYGYGQGLVHYLNYEIFTTEDRPVIKERTCDLILELYAEMMADKLSSVILYSRAQNYTPAKAVELLKESMKGYLQSEGSIVCEDWLAMCVLSLQICDPEQAQGALLRVHRLTSGVYDSDVRFLSESEYLHFFDLNSLYLKFKRDLHTICIQHHTLMHTEFKHFSSFAQLMRRHYPEAFIDILVSLHDTGTIPLDLALNLLSGSACHDDLHKFSHVKDYLEALINASSSLQALLFSMKIVMRKGMKLGNQKFQKLIKALNIYSKRRYIYEEATDLLSKIYLTNLTDNKHLLSKQAMMAQFSLPQGTGHFATRYSWLDYLPPFNGPRSMKQACQYLQVTTRSKVISQPIRIVKKAEGDDQCPCCQCNEDLLKLQSLLCSSYSTERLVNHVHSYLGANSDATCKINGRESLYVLCLSSRNLHNALDWVLDTRPTVLPHFVFAMLGKKTLDQWQYMLDHLLSIVRVQAESPTAQQDVYVGALTNVLAIMSEVLSARDFLCLLPHDGSLKFFLPYISSCCRKQEVNGLRQRIVDKGSTLKASI